MNLRKICYENIKHPRFQGIHLKKEYIERLEEELEVFEKYHLEDYMFIVSDIINYCKSQNWFVGPGRGSAAGSLVCFLIGITEIDPIRWGLLFSRFLNESRITKGDASSMPDIDFDVPQNKRQLVIDYLKNKYGENNVFAISNYSYFSMNSAIRKVVSVTDFEANSANDILKKTEFKNSEGVSEILSNPKNTDFKYYYENNMEFKEIVDIADKMNGNIESLSQHASGLVIFDEDISNIFPLRRSKGAFAVQGDKKDVEAMGGVKIDLLGLKTADVIEGTLELIGKHWSDLYKIPLDIPEIYDMIRRGDSNGCFQIGTPEMKKCLMDIKCSNFDDLVAAVALVRPGSKDFIPKYANIKLNGKNILDEVPYFKHILDEVRPTYGIILFQEQFMQISKSFSGFSDTEADNLRKAIGKKDMELMKSLKEKFINQGKDKKDAEKIWNVIEKAAEYSFNKSHSVAYALIGYFTAWLKYNYPVEFTLNVLKFLAVSSDEKQEYIVNSPVEIMPPTLEISTEKFSIHNNKIYFGLEDLKGTRKDAIKRILKKGKKMTLKERGFEEMINFILTCNIDQATFKAMNLAGMFRDYFNIGKLDKCQKSLFKELSQNKNRKKSQKTISQLADFFMLVYDREISSSKEDDSIGIFYSTFIAPEFPEEPVKDNPPKYLDEYDFGDPFSEVGLLYSFTSKLTKHGKKFFICQVLFKKFQKTVLIFDRKDISEGFYLFKGRVENYLGNKSFQLEDLRKC